MVWNVLKKRKQETFIGMILDKFPFETQCLSLYKLTLLLLLIYPPPNPKNFAGSIPPEVVIIIKIIFGNRKRKSFHEKCENSDFHL